MTAAIVAAARAAAAAPGPATARFVRPSLGPTRLRARTPCFSSATSTRPLLQVKKIPLAPRYTRSIHGSCTRRQDVFHSQLQGSDSASILESMNKPHKVQQTLTEKLLSAHNTTGKPVKSGDFMTLRPKHCMTHDNSWPVATKFMEMGATAVHDRKQLVMTLDHDVQNKSETNLKKYTMIEAFAKDQGVDFYPAGRGIGHQIMVEEGYAWPGSVVVASDSHTNMYGGVGCLGTPVVRTGAADIWATGTTWLKVPPVAKVTLKGKLPVGATGKDVIVALCALFNNDEVLNHAIEFVGSEETMESLSIDDRLAIANMTTEWGALSGLFPIDKTLEQWFANKLLKTKLMGDSALADEGSTTSSRINQDTIRDLFRVDAKEGLKADPGARYAKSLFIDLSTIAPYVSGPNSVKMATPVKDLEEQRIKVDRAYLVSCTNSRAADLSQAARVFRDAADRGEPARIADSVKLYIAAASSAEQAIAEAEGDWQVLLDAGATPLPSGCGPCIGLGTGLLEPGEVGISSSNRNFKGRMGSTEAKAYLGSPEVVAASALTGIISSPGWYKEPGFYDGIAAGEGDGIERRMIGIEEALEKFINQADSLIASVEQGSAESDASAAAPIAPGFPTHIHGEIVFCDADNINTDGIYPGKYTYQDGVTREKMAEVCMQNYDESFASTARPGDILVSGYNFGCGSSREQAATCILAKGIPLVVAGSFGNIFTTNSINNALMGLEVPRLVSRLRETFSASTTPPAPEKPIQEPEANKQSLDSPPPAPLNKPSGGDKMATRRTGWTLTWDVAKSTVRVTEGEGGPTWEEKVPEIPPNVQSIVAGGGLVKSRQSMFGKQ